MLHYYLNLFDGHETPAKAAMWTAKNQFEQFEQYLRHSINALKKKQISAAWEKVKTPNLAKLELIGGLYEYKKQTTIRVSGNQKGNYRIELIHGSPNFAKKIEYQIGDKEGEVAITESDYENHLIYIEGLETSAFDNVKWGFADIKLRPAWFSFGTNDILRNSGGREYKITKTNNDEITLEGALDSGDELFFGNDKIVFAITKEPLPLEAMLSHQDFKILPGSDHSTVFYTQKEIKRKEEINPVNSRRVSKFMDFYNICFEADPAKKLEFSQKEGSGETIIVLHDDADYGKTVVSNGIYFTISRPKQSDIDSWKIQLKEINVNDAEDEQNALSPLRYFFDENVKVTDSHNNEYVVARNGCNQDENQIVLMREATPEEKQRGKKRPVFCVPPEGSTLQVKVDTQQLRRQLGAISILKQMPHKNHKMLIRLFEDRTKTRWPEPKRENMSIEWLVLNEETRSGCSKQRDFVVKALNTPDFAILEGPPGSGKTTVILELICQLILRKKRVLLCGSTNVAIDNILERLIEKRDGASLIDRIDILPVRIGRAERVDQNIAEYQIDNLVGESSTKEEKILKQRLLLDAANLVCGTTMGIVNHPKFREQIGRINDQYGKFIYDGDSPVVPEFDYLIVDESSKTPFQEFLVPALYAERWILAGDVMQLSPFTDSESVTYNFEKIALRNSEGRIEEVDADTQKAVFYLDKFASNSFLYWNREKGKPAPNRFIIPFPLAILGKIVMELAAGRIERFSHEVLFICITKDAINLTDESTGMPWQHRQVLTRTPENVNYLELVAANIILVEKAVMKDIKKKLPATHAVLRMSKWEETPHAYYHNAIQQKGTFGYYSRGRTFTNSFEIVEELNDDFKKRSWAQEIAWRIDSEHQLRLAGRSERRERLNAEIENLTPASVNTDSFIEARNMIAAMSFPSILESLVNGIKGKKPKVPSTISDGFYGDDLRYRKITLTYQHRMHPNISVFPRKQYYCKEDEDALKDLEKPKHIKDARNWGYSRYPSRSMWIDVKSPTKGSRNIYEVEAMMQHLKNFLDYAVNNPQPEGKEWNVACLAFYRGQEQMIREGGTIYDRPVHGLQALTGKDHAVSNFVYNENKKDGLHPVYIKLHSVDRFQGHEADFVLLSMSQTHKDGFLDNPNRLNVSITRAKFQLLIFGKYDYFSGKTGERHTRSEDLKALALAHENSVIGWRQQ